MCTQLNTPYLQYRARSETIKYTARSETRKYRTRSETRKQTRSNDRSSKFRQWSHDAERRRAASHGRRVVKWSSLLFWSALCLWRCLRPCLSLFLSALARFACGRRASRHGAHFDLARKLPVREFDGVSGGLLLHAPVQQRAEFVVLRISWMQRFCLRRSQGVGSLSPPTLEFSRGCIIVRYYMLHSFFTWSTIFHQNRRIIWV